MDRLTGLLTERLTSRGRGDSRERKAGKRRRWATVGSLGVGVVAAVAVWLTQWVMVQREFGPLLSLHGGVYDRGMTGFARTAAKRPGARDVVVVAVKESTLRDLDNIPSFVPGLEGALSYRTTPRAFHARLLRNLKALGAAAVAFDIVFDADKPEVDAYFAEQMRAHGKVILGAVEERTSEGGGEGAAKTLVVPNATLRDASAGFGFVNMILDTDKTLRKFRWWFRGMDEDTAEDRDMPHFAVAAAAAYRGQPIAQVIDQEFKARGSFLGKKVRFQAFRDPLDPPSQPPSRQSYIRYYGEFGAPAGEGSVINYENLVRSGQDDEGLQKLKEQIQGKLVLVGDETSLNQDIHRTPVISTGPDGGSTQQMPGVEVQAQMVQTLLSGEYPTQAPWWSNIALVFVVCVVIALLGRFVAPGVLLGCAAALLVGLYFLSTSLLAGPGATYLEPVTASAGVVVASLLEIGFMFLAERRDRESVKRQLVRHVGEGVAEKLTDEEWPEGQGEACKITMLFSDLQGFTSISETMTPPEICSLLNRYFGVVMPILDEHHGTLDKLIGDGMMAYFGWPARSPEHATNAIKCAVAVQQALEEWQRQPENAGMPPLRTRIGIHTGEVVIGEVGSGTRVEFTVIGDVVNVASRLEGMNKEYGTTILVSEDSRDLAGAIVPYQYRGVATMRGRREPMPVYSIDPGPASGRQRTATGSRATAARTAAAGSETAPGGAGTQPAPDGGTTERLD